MGLWCCCKPVRDDSRILLSRGSNDSTPDRSVDGSTTGALRRVPPADWPHILWDRRIGSGAFAEIWAATLPPFGPVAVKMLRDDRLGEAAAVADLEHEAGLLRRVHHQHILCALSTHRPPDGGLYIALDRLDSTLADQMVHPLHRTPCDEWFLRRQWTLARAIKVGAQLASALEYLHERAIPGSSVLHRDLKPDNVGFIGGGAGGRAGHGRPVLLDFGCAKVVCWADRSGTSISAEPRSGAVWTSAAEVDAQASAREPAQRATGPATDAAGPTQEAPAEVVAPPPLGAITAVALDASSRLWDLTGQTGASRYMAPEVYRCQPYGLKSESYSFSLVLWHMLAKEAPYDALCGAGGLEGFERSVIRGGTRPPIRAEWPAELRQLLTECFLPEASERPSMRDVAARLRKLHEVGALQAAAAGGSGARGPGTGASPPAVEAVTPQREVSEGPGGGQAGRRTRVTPLTATSTREVEVPVPPQFV